jgi:hypothetical protein
MCRELTHHSGREEKLGELRLIEEALFSPHSPCLHYPCTPPPAIAAAYGQSNPPTLSAHPQKSRSRARGWWRVGAGRRPL